MGHVSSLTCGFYAAKFVSAVGTATRYDTRIGLPNKQRHTRNTRRTSSGTNATHAQGCRNTQAMPPSGKIEVAEEGNRRRGEMTPSEMRQCAKDIVGWFTQHAELDAKGVDQSVIDDLSKKRDVPLALEELWREAATDVWFEGYQLLHPQSIGKMLSDVDAPYVPFARDIDDALLVVGDDAVYEYEMGDGRGDRLSSSIADYLEAYRNKLLEGRFEYMDGDGCVETMASAPSRGK